MFLSLSYGITSQVRESEYVTPQDEVLGRLSLTFKVRNVPKCTLGMVFGIAFAADIGKKAYGLSSQSLIGISCLLERVCNCKSVLLNVHIPTGVVALSPSNDIYFFVNVTK